MTDQTMSELVAAAVAKQMEPDNIVPKIEEAVGKMIDETVKSSLRSFSENGKLIEEAVVNSLKIGTLDLPSYGTTVCTILKEQIDAKVSELVAGQLKNDMDELLSLAPKEVRLSKIVSDMVEAHYEDYGDVVTCIVEDRDSDMVWVYLDPDDHYDHDDKYRCQISLFIDGEGKIKSGSTKDRLGSGGTSLDRSKDFGKAYSLEQKVRSYWACGTRIIVDEDEVSTFKGDY